MRLFETIDDAPARQIVRREFHEDFVARQNLDEILSHPARDVREDLVLVVQFDLEHRIG